jgi:hypothetical protein
VPRVAGGIEAGGGTGALDDVAYGVGGEARGLQLPVAGDCAENGAGRDAAHLEPLSKGADGAGVRVLSEGNAALLAGGLLVSLAATQVDGESVLGFLEVAHVQGDELTAAEGRSEAEEEERGQPEYGGKRQ